MALKALGKQQAEKNAADLVPGKTYEIETVSIIDNLGVFVDIVEERGIKYARFNNGQKYQPGVGNVPSFRKFPISAFKIFKG